MNNLFAILEHPLWGTLLLILLISGCQNQPNEDCITGIYTSPGPKMGKVFAKVCYGESQQVVREEYWRYNLEENDRTQQIKWFDEEGLLIKQTTHTWGNMAGVTTYLPTYDKNGLEIEALSVEHSGEAIPDTLHMIFQHDSIDGKLVKTDIFSTAPGENRMIGRFEYFYDNEQDHWTEQYDYLQRGDSLFLSTKRTFDDDGNPKLVINYHPLGDSYPIQTKTFKYEGGQILEETYARDTILLWERQHFYDANGRYKQVTFDDRVREVIEVIEFGLKDD